MFNFLASLRANVSVAQETQDQSGYLEKSPSSIVIRDAADVTDPVDYSASDFSVEFIYEFNSAEFVGDYPSFIRHGDRYCGWSTSYKGWELYATADFRQPAIDAWMAFGFSDGNGHRVAVGFTREQNTVIHVIATYAYTTGTLTLYVDGDLVNTSVDASLSCTASIGQELVIGGRNKLEEVGTWSSSTPRPKFRCYLARIWSDELSSNDVAALYTAWHGSYSVEIPNNVTGTVTDEWRFNQECSDKNGAEGTGWVKANVGSNHLQMSRTSSHGDIANSEIRMEAGSIACSSPADEATGISGADYLEAVGTVAGNGTLTRYYFEIDTVNTFDSGNEWNSGWVLENRWRFRGSPSTEYFWRVKCMSGSVSSSWSATRSFTTRAATNWYARRETTAGTYGDEDGTSYANAWNGLPRYGGQELTPSLASLGAQADVWGSVAPGDTLFLCGDWYRESSSTADLNATTRHGVCTLAAKGNATDNAIISLQEETYPGTIWAAFKYTGAISWNDEGGGVYSTTTYPGTGSWYYIGEDNSGVPDFDWAWDWEHSLPHDATETLSSAGWYIEEIEEGDDILYVRLSDDSSPDNKLWYIHQTYALAITQMNCQYVEILGGDWCYTSFARRIGQGAPGNCTNMTYTECRSRWGAGVIPIYADDDDYTFDQCEIGDQTDGIYGTNISGAAHGDRCTVKKCHIWNMTGGGDSHGVGIQNGQDWTVEDNYIHHTGTAIEAWCGGATEGQHNIIVQRNVIHDITYRSNTKGQGISFSQGNNAAGRRTGCEMTDNIMWNLDNSGFNISIGEDAYLIKGNLVNNFGNYDAGYGGYGIGSATKGTGYAQKSYGTFTDNVVINRSAVAGHRYVSITSDNADWSEITLDENLYYDDADTSSTAGMFVLNASYSFDGLVTAGTFEQNGVWGDPATPANLPAEFDANKIAFALADPVGDIDADGTVYDEDLTALDTLYGGTAPYAMRKYIQVHSAGAKP